jgi:hypothetical protein
MILDRSYIRKNLPSRYMIAMHPVTYKVINFWYHLMNILG